AGTACVDHPERDIAGAPGNVEQGEGRVTTRRVDGGDQRVFPGAMQPAGHQVVHHVVALGNAMEYVVHQRLLLLERHPSEAEMAVVTRVVLLAHGHCVLNGGDHSASAPGTL